MERYLFTYLPRLDPRLHVVVLAAPLLLLVLAGGSYFIGPEWRHLRQLRTSRAVLSEALGHGEEIAKELEIAQESVARLENRLFGKNMNLPMKQLEAQIIGRLQEISSRNRVQLDGVRPGAQKTLRMLVESPIEVEVTGDYFDIARWLQELSGELGFIVVKEYDMQPITHATTPTLRMKMTIVSYRMEGV